MNQKQTLRSKIETELMFFAGAMGAYSVPVERIKYTLELQAEMLEKLYSQTEEETVKEVIGEPNKGGIEDFYERRIQKALITSQLARYSQIRKARE
jgi:hypothetical protein